MVVRKFHDAKQPNMVTRPDHVTTERERQVTAAGWSQVVFRASPNKLGLICVWLRGIAGYTHIHKINTMKTVGKKEKKESTINVMC